MKSTRLSASAAILFLSTFPILRANPLPDFTLEGVVLHPKELSWIPTGELEHPGFIRMEGLVEKPLGRYYLYYAPHKHEGIGLAYSDNIEGPWKEYEGNPVLKGPAAPDIRWIEDQKKFFMWGHTKNSQTELWTSDDGIHFERRGVSITASKIGTKNATYTRFYEYPLEKFGSRYILLYSGYLTQRKVRSVWLAHSKDAVNWTQLRTPLVEPTPDENKQLYCPAFVQWQNRNFIVYADRTSWRGGKLRYVELDGALTPVGGGGQRYTLIDPPAKLAHRLRSPEFLVEGDTIHMIAGGGKNPRLIVYGSASVERTAEIKRVEQGAAEQPATAGESK